LNEDHDTTNISAISNSQEEAEGEQEDNPYIDSNKQNRIIQND